MRVRRPPSLGRLTATLTYTAPSGSLLELATFGTGGGPSGAVSAILGATNAGVCSAGARSSTAGTRPSAGRRVPAASAPRRSMRLRPASPAARGLWSVSGITESTWAEEGTGALAPAFTRAGTVSVWNGAGLRDQIDLAGFDPPTTGSVPVAQPGPSPTTSVTYGGLTVAYEGSLTVGAAADHAHPRHANRCGGDRLQDRCLHDDRRRLGFSHGSCHRRGDGRRAVSSLGSRSPRTWAVSPHSPRTRRPRNLLT